MIIGIGTDIIEIERIKKAISRSDNFLKRMFSEDEIEYFKERKFSPQTIAGNFAAKEAMSKALGTGFRGFNFNEIEILRDSLGKPLGKISKNIEDTMNLKGYRINVSISHDNSSAIAFVIIEEV
ncbi:holo-ACP synthase [Clostridium chrysemydis]|uniref:holo-ACP synthase n=1 Tax=Clostridium chrysemydis TaxID=2665504 RepID=UPI0018844181|nr:holo-ACP synthase [Clostridium chrysemydis]